MKKVLKNGELGFKKNDENSSKANECFRRRRNPGLLIYCTTTYFSLERFEPQSDHRQKNRLDLRSNQVKQIRPVFDKFKSFFYYSFKDWILDHQARKNGIKMSSKVVFLK